MNAKCKWAVENFTDSEDYRDLISAVQESGRDCQVIDRRNNFDFDPSPYKENDCVLFQGSIQMTRHVRNKLPKGCRPIAYCTEKNYDCGIYFQLFNGLLFNDKYTIMNVSDLKDEKFETYAEFGKEALIFIRPTRGDKPFSGQLLDLQDFDRFWKNNLVCNADDTDGVVVSTPKTIVGEWRFVCSNRPEIIAYSTYIFQGQKTLVPSAPQNVIDFCQKVLEVGYFPDPVFTVDICWDADQRPWLLEFNSFSSAGLYAADKKKIVDKVSEIAESDFVSGKTF